MNVKEVVNALIRNNVTYKNEPLCQLTKEQAFLVMLEGVNPITYTESGDAIFKQEDIQWHIYKTVDVIKYCRMFEKILNWRTIEIDNLDYLYYNDKVLDFAREFKLNINWNMSNANAVSELLTDLSFDEYIKFLREFKEDGILKESIAFTNNFLAQMFKSPEFLALKTAEDKELVYIVNFKYFEEFEESMNLDDNCLDVDLFYKSYKTFPFIRRFIKGEDYEDLGDTDVYRSLCYSQSYLNDYKKRYRKWLRKELWKENKIKGFNLNLKGNNIYNLYIKTYKVKPDWMDLKNFINERKILEKYKRQGTGVINFVKKN